MEVFVHRDPKGYITKELEGVEELAEFLESSELSHPLNDNEEVHVEITARWSQIRELLSLPYFRECWFNPEDNT